MRSGLDASVSESKYFASSFSIVDLGDEALEIRDVAFGELAVAAEVRRERRDAHGEQAIEQAFAFGEEQAGQADRGSRLDAAVVKRRGGSRRGWGRRL